MPIKEIGPNFFILFLFSNASIFLFVFYFGVIVFILIIKDHDESTVITIHRNLLESLLYFFLRLSLTLFLFLGRSGSSKAQERLLSLTNKHCLYKLTVWNSNGLLHGRSFSEYQLNSRDFLFFRLKI